MVHHKLGHKQDLVDLAGLRTLFEARVPGSRPRFSPSCQVCLKESDDRVVLDRFSIVFYVYKRIGRTRHRYMHGGTYDIGINSFFARLGV